ncbi:MAG: hypothetical protein LOY01_02565 [Brachybacterium paraconglomeratum]|nr:hypothetical protein [Brachybacterium paraconglomeratum]
MTWTLLWMLLWRHLAGIVLGALAWTVRRRGLPALEAGRAVTAAVAGGAVVLLAAYSVLGAMSLWVEAPRELWSAVFGARYALPLVLGLAALIALGAVRPHRAPIAGATLAPRTWRSFLEVRWLSAVLLTLVLVLVLTLAAGTASRPDEDGEYTRYVVHVGSGTLGTGIYGWHHSALPLVLLVPLGAATWWALSGIARPPLAEAEPADAANRRLRSANVARVALGALLLHLGTILTSLANTSRLSGTFSGGDRGQFSISTPFAALSGALDVLGAVAACAGCALWVFTALTAVPAPSVSRSRRSAVPS